MRVIVLLLALALAAPLSAEVNPVYARLKGYRTYVAIQDVKPRAHHFYVWFSDIEPCLAQVAGNTVAEMEALTEEDLHMSWGAFGLPPDSVDPVPDAVKPLADAMVAQIQKLHPDARNFKVRYEGDFRTVSVQEIMPRALPGDPRLRPAAKVEATLKVLPDGRVDGTYGMAMAGHGLLVHPAFEDEYTECPRFVDHVMPAELEGTSLLYGPIFGRSYEALCAKIVQAADAITAGTYTNPIEGVLTAQGDTQLPPHYSTLLKLSIDMYARAEDWANQVGESPQFVISVRSGLAGPVTQSVTSARTGLTYTLTADFRALRMSVRVSGPSGEVSASYPLILTEGQDFVTEGDSAALTGGWMFAEHTDDSDLSLPGANGFTRFDIYPESSIYGSLVPLPEGATLSPRIETKNRSPRPRGARSGR